MMGEVVSIARIPQPGALRSEVAPWASALRDQGLAAFDAVGLPHRRIEAWRYSNLAQAMAEKPRPASAARAAAEIPGAYVVDFVDGRLAGVLPPPPAGVETHPLAAVLADPASPFTSLLQGAEAGHPIVALNASCLQEGVVLRVRQGAHVAAPLHLRFRWSEEAAAAQLAGHVRILIALEEGAQATLFETHLGAPAFATVVTDLSLAAESRLAHVRLETLDGSARQTAVTTADLARAARYQGVYYSEGAHFARHEALLTLSGEDAQASLDGAYLLDGARHCDNTTVVTHAAPRTASRQTFRGVLAGKARGVYQGCVKVRREAQATDARQLSRALLLSRGAELATKPELEIFADDVKCSHGATAGELDEAALFFLRARGIPETEARAMLIEAFLAEALAMIESDALRAPAEAATQAWLAGYSDPANHVA
jgi:Fe-S cluster assembly protein SufD